MTQAVLTIAGRQFFPDMDAIAAVEDEIARLVRHGGGFLTIQTGTGIVDVFVSAGMAITVDHLPGDAFDSEETTFLNFDDYA